MRTLDKLRGETRYSYQANGQLRSRDTGSILSSEEFRYDAAGNRLDFNARQFARVTDNRIAKWRNCEYRYDAWGNLIEKFSGPATEQRFEYDCENRLIKAETFVAGKLTATGQYRYDSLGRRIFKEAKLEEQAEQKRFLWQGLRLLCEAAPETSRLYLYESGSYAPMARVDKAEGMESKIYYFHTDQTGIPLELTNTEGDIVWQANYRAWGEVENELVGQMEQNLRLQGQYFDHETNMHYNLFRYYDPGVARYISSDPIGLLGGVNLYRYAPNPISWIDPLGWVTYNTMPGIDGFQKHHLIPQQLSNHAAIKAAEINIHRLPNVMYLPKFEEFHPVRSIHRGPHADYTRAIERRLNAVHKMGLERGWAKAEYREAIRAIMVDERRKLRLGQTILNQKFVRGTACG